MSRWTAIGARWGGGLVVAAVILWGGLMLMEDRFIYFPTRLPPGWSAAASGLLPRGLSAEECSFPSGDGPRLHGLWCRSADGPHDPEGKLLLWFHGNAGNLADRLDMVGDLCRLPVTIFIVDYRGYGLSEGKPSEEGLYLDAQAAWDYLTTVRRVPPERIVLFGKSLGGAVAVDLATKVRPAGLIVQSAFTSVPDMAAVAMPFIPRILVRTKLNSLENIKSIQCPKLFIHSPADEVVPYEMGRCLFEAAPEPKEFYEVSGSGHNETWLVGGDSYLDRLRSFMDTV